MARTVVGYFNSLDNAAKVIETLVAQGNDPELITIAYDEQPENGSNQDEYDTAIEQAPMIAFKDFVFGADITEEDSVYYNKLLNEGDALVAVYVPSNEAEGREWEEKAAKKLANVLAKAGAYDHEIRKIYSNRPGLTTYPQNRYLDPVGPNQLNRSRIPSSRSPLNNEVSNVIAVDTNVDFYEQAEQKGGRKIESAVEFREKAQQRKKTR
jgi:hypothetical protein